MPDHNLTNPRTIRAIPDGTGQPLCTQCRRPLADVKQLSDIVTGAHNRRYCSEACYDAWIKAAAAQDVIDFVASDRYKPYVPTWARSESARPENSAPCFTADPAWEGAAAARARHDAKTPARKTAEAAANVVGFVIWLVVVSAIAAVIFAACGIRSM